MLLVGVHLNLSWKQEACKFRSSGAPQFRLGLISGSSDRGAGGLKVQESAWTGRERWMGHRGGVLLVLGWRERGSHGQQQGGRWSPKSCTDKTTICVWLLKENPGTLSVFGWGVYLLWTGE